MNYFKLTILILSIVMLNISGAMAQAGQDAKKKITVSQTVKTKIPYNANNQKEISKEKSETGRKKSIFSIKQNAFNQLDFGYMPTKGIGGFQMHGFNSFGDKLKEKAIRFGIAPNIILAQISVDNGDADVPVIFTAGLLSFGFQANLGNNFYTGFDFGPSIGFSWIKDKPDYTAVALNQKHTYNSHLNYGALGSIYVGFNTGGEKSRFTARAGINPYFCMSSSVNALGATNVSGLLFNISMGFAINKAK